MIRIACLTIVAVAGVATAQVTPPRVLAFDELLRGDEAASLRWPVAVASASASEIAVAEARPPALFLFRHGEEGWHVDKVVPLPATPVGAAFDGERYLVSMAGRQELASVSRAGARGAVPLPEGTVPRALAPAAVGGALVYDRSGRQVLRLTSTGAVTSRTPVAGFVTGLADDGAGGFLAAFGAEGVIRAYAAGGEASEPWSVPAVSPVPAWPAGLAADGEGNLFVVDRHGQRLVVRDRWGALRGIGSRRGWDPGLIRFPSGAVLLADGRLAVVDQGNGRVQIFRLAGGS